MIPVLKKETEIKKEPNGAIIINPEENKHRFLSPAEAFIFTLFDGTKTLEDIADLLSKAKDSPEKRKS